MNEKPWKPNLPLTVQKQRTTGVPLWTIHGANGEHLTFFRDRDRAELIVRAVNSHEALREALEWAKEGLENYDPKWVERDVLPKIRAALAQAEGKT